MSWLNTEFQRALRGLAIIFEYAIVLALGMFIALTAWDLLQTPLADWTLWQWPLAVSAVLLLGWLADYCSRHFSD